MDATRSLAEMCGAKIFVSKEDMPLVEKRIEDKLMYEFTPDVLLEDGDVIELGNTKIECMLTPGHTDGTMSFFFDVTDGKNTYRAGMFGGAGINTLTYEYLTNNNMPFENRQKYFDSIEKLEKVYVDINVGNHVGGNDTVGNLKKLEDNPNENPFINPQQWLDFLQERRQKMLDIIEEEKEK